MIASGLHTRRYLAFVHIEKAAGTTFIHMLRRNYLFRYMDVRPYSPESHAMFTARDLELSLRINPWICAFGGHAVRPISDLCDVFPNVRFVTILRDPVRRYISQYLYGNAILKLNIGFEQFLADERTHDFQTRKIAGQANLQCAQRILKERFLVVGLVERFDQFLSTLATSLDPDRFECSYETRNAGSYPQEEAELFDAYGKAVREVNQVDAALYRHVQTLLEARGDAPSVDRHSAGQIGFGERVKYYADGALRKSYYEPVTGLMRLCNGLPMKGSY